MKMPENQISESAGLFEYEETSYFTAALETNDVEDFNTTPENDFSEYLWMENEEEFDKEEMQRLEEEALMEQCIEAMLADENPDGVSAHLSNFSDNAATDVTDMMGNIKLDGGDIVKRSTLNPLAAEFIPSIQIVAETITSSS